MKRRFSLAQKLASSIAIAVVVQVALIFYSFLGYFGPRLEENTYEVIEQGVLASAETLGAKWSYEILLAGETDDKNKLNPELQSKIKEVLKTEKSVSGIAIYKRKSDSKKISGLSDKKLFRMVGKSQQKNMDFEVDLAQLRDGEKLKKHTTYISGANAYAWIAVRVEEEVVGYLIYGRSIRAYHNEMSLFKQGMGIVVIVFVLLQLIAVFVIGKHSGRPVKSLADTASQIASGDLTQQPVLPPRPVTEVFDLSRAILEMSRAINKQVTLIKSLTMKATGVSLNVSRAMSHLASSASEQAAAVSETASTVEEMEKTGKGVVEAARRIVDAAERSAEASNRGRNAVNTASGIMVKIKEDSANISSQSRTLLANVEEVGNIINSVNSIAEQSKILAVNASIEAAKAGEFGSGFAVVAQEVKSLAGQSKDATEQITRTLTSIRHSVEIMVRLSRDGEERTIQGVSSIANTGAIVNDLSDAIQEASEVANEIESAVNQQSMGLSQIASAMEEINISASENQEISYNMEKSTMEMTEALEELSLLVDVWTIADTPITVPELEK
ncbi:MAG: methyl-accepting chemotaxis protein [Deltaproteobacteria bacterium]|nr:methyl-accepting chemotaxis protein [Deltaproteobacteria bacterium]